jgi:hypothetical protein
MDIDRIFASPLLYGKQHDVMKAFYQNMVTKLFWPDADEQSLGVMSRV